jgi:uncharacterized membrane protein
MTKTVISAYLIAQALLHYAMLLFQSVPQDVVEAVVDVDNTMLKFSLEHPALGILGQLIYVSSIWHRQLALKQEDVTVKIWNNEQTMMLGIRIFLAVVFSMISSTVLTNVGTNQTFFNMPAGLEDLFVYLIDIVIGYFVIRMTKLEFEEKIAQKLKDRMKI